MIWTILLIACSNIEPTDCRQYPILAHDLSLMPTTQYIEAQQVVAEWLAFHPSLYMKSFTVTPGQGT